MNQNIDRVILPGIGPVCPECFSSGHIAQLSVSPGEIFSFGVADPQAELSRNVDAARALIAVRPRAAQRLDRTWLEHWLAERSTFTTEHLDHIPSEKLDEPCILVELVACPPGGEPAPFRILIDGTHRAARLLRDGVDAWACLLTEQEQRVICTYRRERRLMAMPTFQVLASPIEQPGSSWAVHPSPTLPDFDVTIQTVRSGTRVVRIAADDPAVARSLVQTECDTGQHHLAPEWCTDDIETTVLYVKQVVLDDVTLITADGVSPGTLYADDTLRRKQQPRA